MKYLYIVDYWVPFPSSEYGGLINLIAESDDEAFDILSSSAEFDATYTNRIMEKIVTSRKYALLGEHNSGILEQFIT